MTLDEAIKYTEELMEEYEKVADTGTLKDGYTLDELYCDDTEVIEEHKERCRNCAADYQQFAEWLRDYKRLKEREPCDDCISRQGVIDRIRESIETYHNQYTTDMLNMWGLFTQFIKEMPPVKPQEPKTGHWVYGVCDKCNYDWGKDAPIASVPDYCPNCGAKMVEPQESEDKE